MSFVVGCAMLSQHSFDALSFEPQRAIRTASAKLAWRYDELGREQDDALLGELARPRRPAGCDDLVAHL